MSSFRWFQDSTGIHKPVNALGHLVFIGFLILLFYRDPHTSARVASTETQGDGKRSCVPDTPGRLKKFSHNSPLFFPQKAGRIEQESGVSDAQYFSITEKIDMNP